MITIMEIAKEIAKVRDVVDQIEVSGRNNAAKIAVAYDTCNSLIDSLNKAAQEIQNGTQKVSEENGESDTGTAE